MNRVAVVGLSARALAEAACAAGFEVVALDLFGDRDTRRASVNWRPIGRPDRLRIDGPWLLRELSALAREGRVSAWMAGAGFDGRPELLARAAAVLPWRGNAVEVWRQVRDPQRFFGVLDKWGVAHPEVRYAAPAPTTGWLIKDPDSCGGTQVRRAAPCDRVPPAPKYLQREVSGRPMSVTFIADGHRAEVLGCNEGLFEARGRRPFVYSGVIGPVPMPARVTEDLRRLLDALTREFGLRGLGSLDLMVDGHAVQVLELNPRPPASMQLYPETALAGHWRATGGQTAASPDAPMTPRVPSFVRGVQTVWAPRALSLTPALCEALAGRPACHDLPAVPWRLAAGDPVCSVSAQGLDAAAVRAALARERDAVLQCLESSS